MDRQQRTESAKSHSWRVRLRTKYHLETWMVDQMDGLELTNEDDGTSLISGELPDMPAVYGLILRMRDLAVDMLRLEVERQENGS